MRRTGWVARAALLASGGTAVGLAVSLTLTGCAAGTPTPTPAPTYTSSYIAPAATTLTPLTGETIPADTVLGPSLAAKIDNHPDARPQIGLEHTDLVFEEMVEGGLTRYVGVWQSDVPAEIGPIRSIRPMDPFIVSPLGGIVAYSGGQQRFVALMKATSVYNAIHGQPDTADVMFRTDAKEAPHNVVVRAPQLIAMHAEIPAPAQQFAFAADVASSTGVQVGTPTSGISLRFGAPSTPSWIYDGASQRYLRFQGAADLDSAGAQLSADNVIVLRVQIKNNGGVPETELLGSGEAWISTGGSTAHATWTKPSQTERIRLVDDTGTVVRLAPGNSWIELVPTNGSADFTPATAP